MVAATGLTKHPDPPPLGETPIQNVFGEREEGVGRELLQYGRRSELKYPQNRRNSTHKRADSFPRGQQ
jgi:hypothetical protein